MKRPFLVILLLWLVACGLYWAVRSPPRPSVTVRFWNGFTGPDGRTMMKIVREFNRQNPDIRVLMQRMDWGTYYNKLFVAGLGGRAPEVFVVHVSSIPRFDRAGLLLPLDLLLSGNPTALPVDDFDPNVWSVVQGRAGTMAVPLDIHPIGMYFNRALLKQAGVVHADGSPRLPAGREEFMETVRAFRSRAPGDPKAWGFVFTNFRTNALALMAQFGGKAVSADGQRCLLDSPANIAALEFCAGLIRDGLAPRPESFDAWIGFRQGRVALAFDGIYLLSDLEKQPELDFGGAPLPVLGREPATWADSHGLCLRPAMDDAKRDAAWRFVTFLSDQSLQWARAGQIPVRISLRETPEFRAMPIQSEFARQIPYARYSPRVPFIFEFFTEFDLAVERSLRGTLPPSKALRIATERINRAIRRENERTDGRVP